MRSTRRVADAGLAGIPDSLWTRLGSAPHRTLVLDYDGTIAPFRLRRLEARPSARLLALAREIAVADGTTMAIVSGRPVVELEALLGDLGVLLIGEHGWETRPRGGRVERITLPADGAAGLRRAVAVAEREGWAPQVERKRSALVLHVRGLPRRRRELLLRAASRVWGEIAEHCGMRLDTIHRGLELRVTGRDKGVAVREIVAAQPAGALVVYIGDDTTDEDAFREVAGNGFAILVGRHSGVSRATCRLPSIPAVEAFLERWLDVIRGRGPFDRSSI